MKVTKITSLPLKGQHRFGYFIVKVETDAGIYGLGESGNWFWGEAVAKAVEHLSELVIGQDPFSTERLWQHMFRASFFPADKVYCNAISGIDIALWDIKGKALDMPVYKLLGGPVRDKVVCYPHNDGATNTELLESCKRSVEEGWKFVRWGQPVTEGPLNSMDDSGRLEPVESMRMAEEQVAIVREAVGPDIQICLDVHTRLDTAHVISLCKDLESYKPFFIEDPLRSENPASYRTLARHVSLPIAAGEQWASKWSFREVIEEELISYARIDLCHRRTGMDGVRTAEGGEGVTGAMIRARIWVDGRLAGGLQALLGAPMAAYSGCGERDGGIGHGKRRSRTGLARVCGDVGLAGGSVADGRRQAGSGMARSRARARLNCSSQGQRRGRCRVNRRAERVIRPAKAKTRRLRVLVVTIC